MFILEFILNIPEPIRLAALAAFGWFAKSLFEMVKGQRKEKRDDFIALTNAMKGQLANLTDRVDKAENRLVAANEETIRCEENHRTLVIHYNELTEKYKAVIEVNIRVQTELAVLKVKIEQYENKENDFIIKNDD